MVFLRFVNITKYLLNFTYIRVNLFGPFAIYQSTIVILEFIVRFGGVDVGIQMVGLELTSFGISLNRLCELFHNLINPAKIEIIFERPGV